MHIVCRVTENIEILRTIIYLYGRGNERLNLPQKIEHQLYSECIDVMLSKSKPYFKDVSIKADEATNLL